MAPHDPSAAAAAGSDGALPELFQRVVGVAEAIAVGEEHRAASLIRALLYDAPPYGTPQERVAHIFARALLRRHAGEADAGDNLYVDASDPRDMLAAFQVLVHATPVIRYGYDSANTALAAALYAASTLHVVDIGIGSGGQWLLFMDLLACRSFTRPRLRLTGIDVPAPGPDPERRLAETGAFLAENARELGIPFTFESIVGQVEEIDFSRIRVRGNEALAVNAAFALHHVGDDDAVEDVARSRDAVLRRLRDLHPHLLTLVEPNVEHNALPFVERVRESLEHYLLAFEMFEVELPGAPRERKTLENAFFGREILNVVVGEGPRRVERHERLASWRQRLLRHGFQPRDITLFGPSLARGLDLRPPYSMTPDEGAILLCWRDHPWVAASAWTPGD